jgi:hypothetical protein
MDPIFSQHGPTACAPRTTRMRGATGSSRVGSSGASSPVSAPAAWPRDRLARLDMLDPKDKTAGLIWLAMHYPAVFDAVLDKVERDDEDDGDVTSDEPEPYCALCGADIGIFLRFGLDWRHYRGGTTISKIEQFDAGHAPVVAWHPARVTAAR